MSYAPAYPLPYISIGVPKGREKEKKTGENI